MLTDGRSGRFKIMMSDLRELVKLMNKKNVEATRKLDDDTRTEIVKELTLDAMDSYDLDMLRDGFCYGFEPGFQEMTDRELINWYKHILVPEEEDEPNDKLYQRALSQMLKENLNG